MKVELDPAVLIVFPKRPDHARQGAEDAAIDGGQATQRLGLAAGLQRHGAESQFGNNLVQDGGVENASGLAERVERNPGDAQESLDSLQLTELLESAEAGDDAVEEVDQQEASILTVLVQLC